MKWKTLKSLTVLGIFLLLTIAACTSDEPYIVKDKVLKDTNLHEVVNAHVYVAYLDPSVDFTRYKKILVRPLNFEKTKIVENYDTSGGRRRYKFELNEKDKATLDEIFQEMMLKNLQEKGDFEVVKSPGPDVLMLTVFVLQVSPNAPKDDSKSRGIGRVTIYTEGAGSITISAGLHDSTTLKPVAEVADSKNSSYMYGQNNRVTNIADVSTMFGQWARQLNSALVNLQTHEVER